MNRGDADYEFVKKIKTEKKNTLVRKKRNLHINFSKYIK